MRLSSLHNANVATAATTTATAATTTAAAAAATTPTAATWPARGQHAAATSPNQCK